MVEHNQTLDKHQLKVLLRTYARLDWRSATNPFTSFGDRKSKFPGLLVVLAINVFASIILAMVVAMTPTFFEGLVLSAATGMVLVSFQMLLEFGNLIIRPVDYDILAPHAVSSKTFYFSKLCHMLLYVTILTAALSVIPAVAGVIAHKEIWWLPVVVLHYWFCNLFASIVMMNLYVWILKKVDRRRLERYLGYTHMVLVFGLMISFNVIPRVAQERFQQLNLTEAWWLKALPSYWFATPIKFLQEGFAYDTLGLLLLGVIVIFGLGRLATGYLSMSYAESLSRTTWSRSEEKPSGQLGWIARLFPRGKSCEDRALMTLVRANFKHDAQFRLGILSFIPLLVFYLIYGLVIAEHAIKNPLAPAPDTDGMVNMLFGIVAIGSPFWVLAAMHVSKEWRAAWVFYAAPIDRVKMALSMSRLATRILLLPMGVVLVALNTYLFGNFLHGLMHSIVLVLMSSIGIGVANIVTVRMPFAMEYSSSNNTANTLQPMLLALVIFGVPIGYISFAGYHGYIGWAIVVTVLLIARVALFFGQQKRIQKVTRTWEFAG